MKIDITKIEGYAEMSAEDKIKALESYEVEAVEDKDVLKYKTAASKASSEAAEYKRQLREKQTEAERIEEERKESEKKLLDELNELKRDRNVSTNMASFLSLGLSNDIAKASAEALVDGKTEDLFKNLKTFITEHDKSRDADALRKTTPPKGSDHQGGEISQAEFDKMTYSEVVKFKEENPELYKKYMKK